MHLVQLIDLVSEKIQCIAVIPVLLWLLIAYIWHNVVYLVKLSGCCRGEEKTRRVFCCQLLCSRLLWHGCRFQETEQWDREVGKNGSKSLVLLGTASEHVRECCNDD